MTVANAANIRKIEAATPNPFAALGSAHEMLQAGARINPDAPAISFFLNVAEHTAPVRWNYREWMGMITNDHPSRQSALPSRRAAQRCGGAG